MQTTIKHKVSLVGTSITGETEAKVTFHPAPPSTGIVFIRTDLPDRPRIKGSIQNAQVDYRWTSLSQGNSRIEHTEHALAAVAGLGLDNIVIELDQPSLPVMPDYSSKEFARALLKAGIVQQACPQETLKIHKPIVVYNNTDIEKLLIALPYEGFKLTYVLDYPHLPLLTQTAELDITSQTFVRELADARSFIIESELKEVTSLTGKLSAQVLVINSGYGKWFWPNEPARHKVLDLLGDLSLLGKKLRGHVIGIRSGHRLNLELCQKIIEECQNDSFSKTPTWDRGTNTD